MPVMVILANYADTGDSYGLLGSQVAATIISDNTEYDCIVIAVGHEYDGHQIKKVIKQKCGHNRPVVGFGNLGGRPDLWILAGELKEEGAVTILGGPQADIDYIGEVDWEKHPNRFQGVGDNFTYALKGPAEQLIPLLNSGFKIEPEKVQGLVFTIDGHRYANKQENWNSEYLSKVNWNNIYRIGVSGLEPLSITTAQVVQQIGCPYAAAKKTVSIDYPKDLNGSPFLKEGEITIELEGCSFCDVARDKGFCGNLTVDTVLSQIENLPEDIDGRKIPFELINESPFQSLPRLLLEIKNNGIIITRISLVTRADWLVSSEEKLREALQIAGEMKVQILLSSVGFESFSDTILKNLNKGYTVDTNLVAIKIMRQLKEEYPDTWYYTRDEGAGHGFIYPTPWDTIETRREIDAVIFAYGLNRDILPQQSTPLIIHHASALGDWIREIESREGIELNRAGSMIEWW
jgi:hypothetical protein